MSKPHILIIPSWYVNTYNPLSGIFFKEQAEALARQKYKVGVISIQNIRLKQILQSKKINFYYAQSNIKMVETFSILFPAIPKMPKLMQTINTLVFKKVFNNYIEKNGMPDIVHLHSFMHGPFAIYIKEKYGIPFVVTEHSSGFTRNLQSNKQLSLARKVFHSSNMNLAVSEQFANALSKQFNNNFEYIPNVVDINFFDVKNIDNSTFNIINIAFLDKNKNQEMLIRAFKKAFADDTNTKLTIVGDGLEYNHLKQLIDDLGLLEQVTLYGKANREEVKQLLQNSNIFVLSSKVETFGVVIVEALACGVPVIATKCGGPESIIKNDKVGILTETTLNSLTNSMTKMKKNIDTYDSMYIRNYAVDNFSEESVTNQLQTIYQKVLAK